MRPETYLFTINGKPMLAPDAPLRVSYTDVEGEDEGRDLNGRLQRSVVRYKVGSWEFTYSNLTDEEKRYMESLFPDTPTFRFGHPGRSDTASAEETDCYRSQYSLALQNACTGLWSELKFRIIEV